MELKAYSIPQYLQWLVPGGGGGGTYFAHKMQSSSPSSTSKCETTFLSIGVLLLQAGDRRARVNHTLTVGGQSHTGNALHLATSWCSLPVISFSMVCTERDTRLSTSSFCFSFSLSSPRCLSEPLGPLNNPFSSCSHAKIRPLIVSL